MLTVVIILAAAIAVLLLVASRKPDIFRMERKTVINAAPEKIAGFINDFHRWQVWSPYEKKDPDMQRTFEGPASGKGAKYAWSGDKNIGSGNMEILDVSPSKTVVDLVFITPFKAHNTAEFTFTPQGGATEVTWAMFGPCPFFAKVMHTVISMDKMVGNDFAKGLADLKKAAEA